MTPAKQRLIEDRAMRDSAKAVVSSNIAYIRSETGRKGLADRAKETGADYLRGVTDGAVDLVKGHKLSLTGGLGLALAGTLAWIFREDIAAAVHGLVEGLTGDDTADGEDGSPERGPEPDGGATGSTDD